MSDPRKKAFGPYLRCLADKMGLRDWTVGIDDDPPDDNHRAEASCAYGRKHIWIQVSESFLDCKEEDQRQTLVHELLHCHFAAMHHVLCRSLGQADVFEAYKLAMEYGVDGIAEEWAKHLPLPSEVREAEEKPSKPKRKTARK